LRVGDPRGVLQKPAGRRHNLRLRNWQPGRSISVLSDKAAQAGIVVHLVNERGTSSTCPVCRQRVTKPRGRTMTCKSCHRIGHRDLFAAATIATRTPGGAPDTPAVLPDQVTHRRAGRHLPGAGRSRRDPRRRPPAATEGLLAGCGPPHPAVGSRSTAATRARNHQPHPTGER